MKSDWSDLVTKAGARALGARLLPVTKAGARALGARLLPAFVSAALIVAAIHLFWRANERQAKAEGYAAVLGEVRVLHRLAADWYAKVAGPQPNAATDLGALTAHLARAATVEGRLRSAAERIADPPARLGDDLGAYLNAIDSYVRGVRQTAAELTSTPDRIPAPRAQAIATQLSDSAKDMARLSATLEDALQAAQHDNANAVAPHRVGAGAMVIALVLLWAAVFTIWRRTGSFRWPGGRIAITPRPSALTKDVALHMENMENMEHGKANPPAAAQSGTPHLNGTVSKAPRGWISQFRTEQALLRHRMIAAMLADELAALVTQVAAATSEPSAAAAVKRLASIAHGLAGLPSEQNTRYEVFDINDCVNDAVVSGTRGAAVEVTRHAGAAPAVFASRTEVVVLLANIIENAALASRDGGSGSIAIRTGEDRGHATVAVSDDGGGVAPTMRERLFEPFHSSRQGHLGVGLAVAARLAERNGGTIAINVETQGVVATVTLPSATD